MQRDTLRVAAAATDIGRVGDEKRRLAVLGPELSGQGGSKYHINQTDSAADPDLVDRLKKFTEAGLRGSRLATQTLALHGVFYLLQTENPRVCLHKTL